MDSRPPLFYSHKELDDIGKSRKKNPRAPWGPIIALVILILVVVMIFTHY